MRRLWGREIVESEFESKSRSCHGAKREERNSLLCVPSFAVSLPAPVPWMWATHNVATSFIMTLTRFFSYKMSNVLLLKRKSKASTWHHWRMQTKLVSTLYFISILSSLYDCWDASVRDRSLSRIYAHVRSVVLYRSSNNNNKIKIENGASERKRGKE